LAVSAGCSSLLPTLWSYLSKTIGLSSFLDCDQAGFVSWLSTMGSPSKEEATMSETFTKSMARNIYFGGSVFFFLVFLALTYHTEQTFPERSNESKLTESVIRGKAVWENNNCIGCHSLLGEGAYFAPELGNVFDRRGGEAAFKPFLHAWMKAQPLGVPGRRAMPQFNLSEREVDDMAEFLKWTSKIDTNNWPPNKEG
jgi:nitric oxide reductase subunit C